ncbi:uncharacterized protein V6R79_020186 [Siganus canaliculatus]
MEVGVEEDEDKAASPGSSCVSMKSDQSKHFPHDFSLEPGPSDSKVESSRKRAASPAPSCVSMESDWSQDEPLSFSPEPGPSDPKRRRLVIEEEQSSSCGHESCRQDQCGQRSRPGPETSSPSLQVLEEHKLSVRRRCERVTEGSDATGSDATGSGTLLHSIYTELYITEGLSEEVNSQHEVKQLETASKKKKTLSDRPIRCQDIFKASPEQQTPIRLVLTNGVAGVGKTFSVQKFSLDWAEGSENQDISLVLLLSFRELNLIRDEQLSLLTLLHVFHPTLQKVRAEQLAVWKLLFIFDGLDESRLDLDFKQRKLLSDVTQTSSVSQLLTNLIQGNLLPSALVWITSRPAAAHHIPPSCVDRATEVRGFTDAQKEDYFRRRVPDEHVSSTIISHIRSSRSLHIMCQIPVFCWITATVLVHMLTREQRGELPKTLTDLYSHFLLVQTQRKKHKYNQRRKNNAKKLTKSDREVLLKLGRLAFEHLQTGNIMFYQEDLERCGLDLTEASVYSGLCTEIFRRESVIFDKTVYCFVHLSVQEFLAAVYMFHCFTSRKKRVLEEFFSDSFIVDDDDEESSSSWDDDNDNGGKKQKSALNTFLINVMEKSLESPNGHLDLFVRFLHGLSLESNQRVLGDLLGQTDHDPEIIQRTIRNLKKMNTKDISPDRSINIFHCLMEMNDLSVQQEIQEFLGSENRSRKKLSKIQCSALAYVLQMSEQVLDELDLQKYRTSIEGKQRLLPAVRNCRTARLSGCELTAMHCSILASALKSEPSHLRELDLSSNYLDSPAVKLLSDGLESLSCRLESLSLVDCEITPGSCSDLGSALEINPSHLKTLDMSKNKLRDSGARHLCDFLKSPQCRLEILRLCWCSLLSSGDLASALKINPSHLRELDLSGNELQNSRVKLLCGFLRSQHCRLEILRLSDCQITNQRWSSLASTLSFAPGHLKELDLSGNRLKDLGVTLLCSGLKTPLGVLESLRLESCELADQSCVRLASALESNPDHLRELDLRGNDLQDSGVKLLSALVEVSHYRLQLLRVDGHEFRASHDKQEGSSSSSKMELDVSEAGVEPVEADMEPVEAAMEPVEAGVEPVEAGVEPVEAGVEPVEADMEPVEAAMEPVEAGVEPVEDETDLQREDHPVETEQPPSATEQFTPERLLEAGRASYRFRCPGPGVFQCSVTRLVFVMEKKAELLYRTVQWDESLLQSAGKMAAGLLFDMKSSEEAAVRQLHLPHCELRDVLLSDPLLSVAHITDDGMRILSPLEVTETHVVVRVPHFSALGLVKDLLKWLCSKVVQGQVLLFLRQPNPKTQRKKLHVHLLPWNIHLDEVKVQHLNLDNIQIPSSCKLIEDHSYSLQCPQAMKIQPQEARFNLHYGPNYHPTFKVRLPAEVEDVMLTVKDRNGQIIWEHDVDLNDIRTDVQQEDIQQEDGWALQKLRSARPKFVQQMSGPNLDALLDQLLDHGFISGEELQCCQAKTVSTQKAREVIDTVLKKGNAACSFLISALRRIDPHLSKVLGLS